MTNHEAVSSAINHGEQTGAVLVRVLTGLKLLRAFNIIQDFFVLLYYIEFTTFEYLNQELVSLTILGRPFHYRKLNTQIHFTIY